MDKIRYYQFMRGYIPLLAEMYDFAEHISKNPFINNKQRLGLLREWRAYWYLCKRFMKWDFAISTPAMDAKGIDIVGRTNAGEYKTFQVGGNYMKGKKTITDYYVQVTDDKVYLRKGG